MFIHILIGSLIFFIWALQADWAITKGYIILGAFAGLFPDVLSFLISGKVTAGKWSHKHRENISHSLLLPLAIFCIFVLWNWQWAMLLFLSILSHPLLDLPSIGWGVKLFYPFNQTTYKLFCKGKIINTFSQEEIDKETKKYGDEHWIKNIYFSLNIIGITEWLCLLAWLVLLFAV